MTTRKKNTSDVRRTPITKVRREPIVGIGAKQMKKGLNWDEVYTSLVNYIKFASKQVYSQYETDSAEDLFQEGQLLLYHCYTVYKDKSFNEFSALFKASLWRKLREISSRKSFIQVDLDDAYDLGYSEDTLDAMFNEYKLQQVADMLEQSPVALTIFKEFINPSSRTLWEARMDIARKSMLREQNYRVAVPKTIQIKGVYIQRAMEIPKMRFNESFRLVKQCVSSVYLNDKDASDDDVEVLLQSNYG